MKGLTWPVWFPYPTAWVRGYVVMSIFTYLFGLTLIQVLEGVTTKREAASGIIFSFVVSWLAVFPMVAYLHHWLMLIIYWVSGWWPSGFPGYGRLVEVGGVVKGKGCQWPGWVSWREGLNSVIVVPVVVFIWGLLLIPLGFGLKRDDLPGLPLSLWVVLVSMAAYAYHYDILVRRWRAAKKRPVSKGVNRGSVKSVDPVEQELGRLKLKHQPLSEGMTRVDHKEKPSHPTDHNP